MQDKSIGLVMLLGARCRCGHEWLPREATGKPRVCPRCKSANWDQAKRLIGAEVKSAAKTTAS